MYNGLQVAAFYLAQNNAAVKAATNASEVPVAWVAGGAVVFLRCFLDTLEGAHAAAFGLGFRCGAPSSLQAILKSVFPLMPLHLPTLLTRTGSALVFGAVMLVALLGPRYVSETGMGVRRCFFSWCMCLHSGSIFGLAAGFLPPVEKKPAARRAACRRGFGTCCHAGANTLVKSGLERPPAAFWVASVCGVPGLHFTAVRPF